MTDHQIEEIVAELLGRPGHEKVRHLVTKLLTDGLGADTRHITFEHQGFAVRGRIDALLGRTVVEIKSDLRREKFAAQLVGYLRDRNAATGDDYVGMVTDGASYSVHALAEDGESLVELSRFTPDPEQPRRLLDWLESVVRVRERLLPEVPVIQLELGRESPLYRRALREIRTLWLRLADHPEVKLKRQLWDRLLRVAYGAEIDAPELFLQHTYLVILAKAVATAALTEGLPASGRDLLDGAPFRDLGILNAVEADFFDWLLTDPDGDSLVMKVARQAQRFDLGRIDTDVLKGLYESLIDPGQRHDLGEYYTPDWLAARICAAAINAPLEQRVIDPACGSGTFLFQALRRLTTAAEAAGAAPDAIVELAAGKVAGIDVHPVAVIFARATWLLAMQPVFARGRPRSLSVPVYLGDALQWNTREIMSRSELEIAVPPADPADPPTMLRFPEDVIDQPQLFDRIVDQMLRFAERGQPRSAMRDWLVTSGVPGDPRMLCDTYYALVRLNEQGRNHIWGYVARNLSRPIWLATERQKADVVVGNPPWVRYSALSRDNQAELKRRAGHANVWVGGKAATANDLSAYFFARAVDLYMRRGGRIAFVMPYAAMSRDPYVRFRAGDFRQGAHPVAVRFTAAWTFPSDVQPVFPVPACVLFAEGARLPGRLPATVTRYSGKLPRRDATTTEADAALHARSDAWPADTGVGASPYRDKFRQGATLVPRRLVIVERVPATGRIPSNPHAPVVRGRTSGLDKKPWSTIPPLVGPVEIEFLKPVYLGESIAPYRVLSHVTGVIPWNPNIREVIDSAGAVSIGKTLLGEWLDEAEQAWTAYGTGGMTLLRRWDYGHALSSQFPVGKLRVVYSKAGAQPAAAILDSPDAVVDHTLYVLKVSTIGEARYLETVLNSETARAAAEQWQAMGQWGRRHFDKAVFNLPIPIYDPGVPVHRSLAAGGRRAEQVAASVDLKEAEHFTRTRRRIRAALIEDGVAGRIEMLVAELIGVPPAATLAAEDDVPDAD